MAAGLYLAGMRVSNRMPQPWRTVTDWVVTIVLAVVFVLAFEAEVAKPYRIPSSSMEPTLHCAKPGRVVRGLVQRPRDREPARVPVHRPEARTDRRLQDAAESGGLRFRRRRRDVREAPDRPAGGRRVRARRPGLRQRPEARPSRTSIRRSATTRPAPGRASRRATTSSSATIAPTRATRERGGQSPARA